MKTIDGSSDHTRSLPAFDTQIRFINLHYVDPPSLEKSKVSREKLVIDHRGSYKPYVKEAIIKNVLSNTNSAPLAGLVFDMFCSSIVDVGNELGVPSYLFFTCNADFLGLMLYLPGRDDEVGREFEELYSDYIIPGYVNPIPSRIMPLFLFNKYGGYDTFVKIGRRFKETKGIIVNTYTELEAHAVKFLLNDFEDDNLHHVYTVGPLFDVKGESVKLCFSDDSERDEIMKWLDDQPDSSVVFLCFGGLGSFDGEQVKEIALGLEQCGHKFLWSLRKPPPKDKFEGPSDYKGDLQEVLSNEFLEKTNKNGLVCGWTPQKEVLGHKSVGEFVSHCGWNSVLESLWFGVPIATWPMYAEQQLNAFQIVKDLGLAVELRLDYRNTSGEVVLGDEIARAVKCVMDTDNEVRKKVKEESENSRLAVMNGGYSYAAFGQLIEDILGNMP
ncbi:anthocyanidin 3-O-glucosyltransferase 2-like [Pistacia vera]|uniref:anthocyanidin 3-O-glucosyltransferase 2-like n=1 Tax=Pistacia vera TaxID=55513 RepID=UPI0012633953|nr:anthocyanidin 3-O-glucosyltransferase 2-like [Pistacia vera]